MNYSLPTPYQVCLLILMNIKEYEDIQREKQPDRKIFIKRCIISDKGVRYLSERNYVSPDFLQQLYVTIQDLGWYMLPSGDGGQILMKMSSTKNWPRLGTKTRTDGNYKQLRDKFVEALADKNGSYVRAVTDLMVTYVDDLIEINQYQ